MESFQQRISNLDQRMDKLLLEVIKEDTKVIEKEHQENQTLKKHLSKKESFILNHHDDLSSALCVSEKSRLTRAVVIYKNQVFLGTAYCDPKDTFNWEFGARLALKRALDHVPEQYHLQVFETYGLRPTQQAVDAAVAYEDAELIDDFFSYFESLVEKEFGLY